MEKIAYSIVEAAKASGVSKSRLYEALNARALVAHKNGSSTVILKSDLEAYLRALPHYRPQEAA